MASQQGLKPNGASVGTNSTTSASAQHENRQKGGTMASIIQQARTRKRKGSLRKTALLGTGKTVSSPVIHHTPPSPASPSMPGRLHTSSLPHSSAAASTRNDEDERSTAAVKREGSHKATDSSTTDEDDGLPTIPKTAPKPPPYPSPLLSPPNPPFLKTDSYFPVTSSSSSSTSTSTSRRRPPTRTLPMNRSPLASLPPAFPLDPSTSPSQPISYTPTATWGYIILLSTWVIFVIGMGSCFEVWSWAWDVGETPYAPPELEDDPTLPIVGYYPSLMVLTGVMAWCWCVVAWVGMKEFKHARMGGEGGGRSPSGGRG